MDIVNTNNNDKIMSFAIGILIVLVFWFFFQSPTIVIKTTPNIKR